MGQVQACNWSKRHKHGLECLLLQLSLLQPRVGCQPLRDCSRSTAHCGPQQPCKAAAASASEPLSMAITDHPRSRTSYTLWYS